MIVGNPLGKTAGLFEAKTARCCWLMANSIFFSLGYRPSAPEALVWSPTKPLAQMQSLN